MSHSGVDKIESELKGKALQIYWHMLRQGSPVGTREVQRALGFSSPSIAHHHLDKLRSLGLVKQDNFGRYYLIERVDVGILQAFTKVGRLMLPRYFFYAFFFTTLLLAYIAVFSNALNIYALFAMSTGALVFWYEAMRVWRRRPY
jgi:hypothetical protein